MGKGGGLRLSREQYSGSFPATRVIPPPKASSVLIITGVPAFSKGKGILDPISTSLKDEDDDIDMNVFFDQRLSGAAVSQEASTSESGQVTTLTREPRFCYYNIKGLLAAKKSIKHVKAKPLRVVEADVSVEEEPSLSLVCNPDQNFPTVRSQERIRYIRKQVSIDPEEADSLLNASLEKPDVESYAKDVSIDKEIDATHSSNRSALCMEDKLLASAVPVSGVEPSPGAEVLPLANKTVESSSNVSDVKEGIRGEPKEFQEHGVQIVDETPEAAATLLMLKEESQSQTHASVESSTSDLVFLHDRDRDSDHTESESTVAANQSLSSPSKDDNLSIIEEGVISFPEVLKEANNAQVEAPLSDVGSGKSSEEVVAEEEDEVNAALPLLEEKKVAPPLINEAVAETAVVEPNSTILCKDLVTNEGKALVNESEAHNNNSVIAKDSEITAVNEVSLEMLKPDTPFPGDVEEASPSLEAPMQISDDIGGKPSHFTLDTAHRETQNKQSNVVERQSIEQSAITSSWRSFIQDLMSASANSSGTQTHQVLETAKDEEAGSVVVKSCGLESNAFIDAEKDEVTTVLVGGKSIDAPLSAPHQIKEEKHSDVEGPFKDRLGRETEKASSSEIEDAEAQSSHDTAIPMPDMVNEAGAGVQNFIVQDKNVELPLDIPRNLIDVKESKPDQALYSEALDFQEKFQLVKDAAPPMKVSVEDFEELKPVNVEETKIEALTAEVPVEKAVIEESEVIQVQNQEAAAPAAGSPPPEPLVEDIKEAQTSLEAVAGIAPFLQSREIGLPFTTVETLSKGGESLVLTEEVKDVSVFQSEVPVIEEKLLHMSPKITPVKAIALMEQPLIDKSRNAEASVTVEAVEDPKATALVTKPNKAEEPHVGQCFTEDSGEPPAKASIMDPLVEEIKDADSAFQVFSGENPVLKMRDIEIPSAVSEPASEHLSGLISGEKEALILAPTRVTEIDAAEDSETDSDASEDSSASKNVSVDIEDSDKDSDGEDSEENSEVSDEDSDEDSSESDEDSDEDSSGSEQDNSASEEDAVKKACSIEGSAFGEDTITVKVPVPVDENLSQNILKTEVETADSEQEIATSESSNLKHLERDIEGRVNRVLVPLTRNEENDDESSLATKDFVKGFTTPVAEYASIADSQASASKKPLPVTEIMSNKVAVDKKLEVLKPSAVVESQIEQVDASSSKDEFPQAQVYASTDELPQALLNSEVLVMETRSVDEIGVVKPITNRNLELGVSTIECSKEADGVQTRSLLQQSTASGAGDNQPISGAEDKTGDETTAISPRIERRFSRSEEASVDVHSEDSEKQGAKSDLSKVGDIDLLLFSQSHSDKQAGVPQVPETEPTLDKKWSQEVSVDVVLPDEPVEVEMNTVDECKASTAETEQSLASDKPGSILERVGPVYENLGLEREAFSLCGKADESLERKVVCTQVESIDVPSTSSNSILNDSESVGDGNTRSSSDLRDERYTERLLSFAHWHEEIGSAETAGAVVADTEEEKGPDESKGFTGSAELSKQLEDISTANEVIKEETQRIWNLKYLKSRPVMEQPRVIQPPKLSQPPLLKATKVVGLSWPPAPLEVEEYTDSDDEATNLRLVE